MATLTTFEFASQRRWAILNEDQIVAIRDGKWAAYQEVLFELGLEIHDTKKPERALPFFILAAYLYINNPDDAFGGWSPTTYVPGAAQVFDYVSLECELLGSTPEEGLNKYSERAQREGQRLKVPVPWIDAREMILENIALGRKREWRPGPQDSNLNSLLRSQPIP